MDSFTNKSEKIESNNYLRIWSSLTVSRKNFWGLFNSSKIENSWFEQIEESLILSDVGAQLSKEITTDLKLQIQKDYQITDQNLGRDKLLKIIQNKLEKLKIENNFTKAPTIIMIVGVNGSGKTTSIGKLAYFFKKMGKKVLLAAGDTFRAAAQEQLIHWGNTNGINVIFQKDGDPAAIAFDSTKAAVARKSDVLIVDTAGRLPTQLHLMEELKKIKKVISKALPQSPHHIWLTLDGGTGQSVLNQVAAFHDALDLSGIIITKLDGSAKGGMLLALSNKYKIPVRFVGLGENIDDLEEFNPATSAEALIGKKT
ncbi:MAG: signal recognition particle-docking protein FtsY [Betaproteobacteria bacterium TMED100]|nr:MAG: signal recognition particle-docking protein FtsY [Betaproteobacteria bacterium TMED100]